MIIDYTNLGISMRVKISLYGLTYQMFRKKAIEVSRKLDTGVDYKYKPSPEGYGRGHIEFDWTKKLNSDVVNQILNEHYSSDIKISNCFVFEAGLTHVDVRKFWSTRFGNFWNFLGHLFTSRSPAKS